MLKLFKKQRGAMFGLDARIALAILAAMGTVTGVSMVQVLKDSRVDKILMEYRKISDALDAMQSDLQMDIYFSGLPVSGIQPDEMYIALYDETVLNTAARNKWRGPYIKPSGSNLHAEYGALRIKPIPFALIGTPTCIPAELANKECTYFLMIGDSSKVIHPQTRDTINEMLDGAGELSPSGEGKVRWDGSNILYIELARALN